MDSSEQPDSVPEPTPQPAVNHQVALDHAMGGPTQASESSVGEDYRVHLPCFDGPLDLLLHLIRKDQLNIYDIPIAQICQTYLEQLELMQRPNVNLAGEFMVMAATLTLMKSFVLLPKDDEGEEEDPRLPLVAQLLEYEKFKLAAAKLDDRSWLHRDIFARPASCTADLVPSESLLDVPVDPIETFQLLVCLKVAIDRTTRPPIQISSDPVSLRDKVTSITELLEREPILEFASLLPLQPGIRDVIVAFLAVLELARLKFIEIIQAETLGPIQIRSVKSLRDLNYGLLDQY